MVGGGAGGGGGEGGREGDACNLRILPIMAKHCRNLLVATLTNVQVHHETVNPLYIISCNVARIKNSDIHYVLVMLSCLIFFAVLLLLWHSAEHLVKLQVLQTIYGYLYLDVPRIPSPYQTCSRHGSNKDPTGLETTASHILNTGSAYPAH